MLNTFQENQDYYRTKQYFVIDPALRLVNETKYYDQYIINTIKNPTMIEMLVQDLKSRGYNVKFQIEIESEWDGHKNNQYEYVSVKSKITIDDIWKVSTTERTKLIRGCFVLRRGISEFWSSYDPHLVYRILYVTNDLSKLYLTTAKDSNNNWLASLDEYDYKYPNIMKYLKAEPVLDNGRYPKLIVCDNDGKFKLV